MSDQNTIAVILSVKAPSGPSIAVQPKYTMTLTTSTGPLPIGLGIAGGARGFSAYEVAVQNGFVGDEQEWLRSLAAGFGSISEIPNNQIETLTDGIFVAPPQLASAQW